MPKLNFSVPKQPKNNDLIPVELSAKAKFFCTKTTKNNLLRYLPATADMLGADAATKVVQMPATLPNLWSWDMTRYEEK